MNVIREINRINDRELELGLGGASWHDAYKDSAYVFCGGLPFDLTEGDIVKIFSQFGEIVDVNMPRDKETHKPRGFAFVMYEDQRSTVLAVDNLNGGLVLGRTIRVDHVRDYKQPGGKKEDGEFVPPEAPSMNALPPMLGGEASDDSSDSSDGDADADDPMAAYIRAERRKQKALGNGSKGEGSKKSKHAGESKAERSARRAAKRARKEAKRAGRGKGERDHDRDLDLRDRENGARGHDRDKGKSREVKREDGLEPVGRGGYDDLARQFGDGQRVMREESRSRTPPARSGRSLRERDRSPARGVKREDDAPVQRRPLNREQDRSGPARDDRRERYRDGRDGRRRDDRGERDHRDRRYGGEDRERGGRYNDEPTRTDARGHDAREERYTRR